MDTLANLTSLLNKAQKDAGLNYIGIFFKDMEIISKTSYRSSKLPVAFGRLIERTLELNDIIPNFKEEFLFSEGKDYSLFVYYVTTEISIGMIHIGKPNFSLLKVTATDLSKSIKPYLQSIREIYEEKVKLLPVEEKEEKIPKKLPKKEEKKVVPEDAFSVRYPEHLNINSISELESVLQNSSAVEEKTEVITPSIEEILKSEATPQEIAPPIQPKEEAFQISTHNLEQPSLEELILHSEPERTEQDISNLEELMEKINREFVREIGPFGNFLFKKKREQFFKDKAVINKFEILKFIQLLSEEISVYQKRQKFIENAKSFLLTI